MPALRSAALQQRGVDTASSTGKLMLAILGAAEFENDIRSERQHDEIDKAKERGVYRGRPATVDPSRVSILASRGDGPSNIAR